MKGKSEDNSYELFDKFVADYPEVIVEDFEEIGRDIILFDSNDHHVLQAAIKCNADCILTYNIKDFPKSKLRPLGIKALNPKAFFQEISKDDSLTIICQSFAREFLNDEDDFADYTNLGINIFDK